MNKALLVESREVACAKRVYLSRAEQTDENGLKCWDNVKVPSCGGRCDSREVSYDTLMFTFHYLWHQFVIRVGRKFISHITALCKL